VLDREQVRWLADEGKTLGALEELADALELDADADPDRVLRHQHHPGHEHGRQHGRLRGRPAAYRRVPSLPDPDRRRTSETTSPATSEVLRRRFGQRLRAGEGTAEELRWRLPDLVVIDGGLRTGQRRPPGPRRARAARSAAGRPGQGARGALPPGRTEPVVLPATSGALYLVQRMRDEAHRFAITYHRQVRAKAQVRSGAG
jgi:excinuclease ABC subunit C